MQNRQQQNLLDTKLLRGMYYTIYLKCIHCSYIIIDVFL